MKFVKPSITVSLIILISCASTAQKAHKTLLTYEKARDYERAIEVGIEAWSPQISEKDRTVISVDLQRLADKISSEHSANAVFQAKIDPIQSAEEILYLKNLNTKLSVSGIQVQWKEGLDEIDEQILTDATDLLCSAARKKISQQDFITANSLLEKSLLYKPGNTMGLHLIDSCKTLQADIEYAKATDCIAVNDFRGAYKNFKKCIAIKRGFKDSEQMKRICQSKAQKTICFGTMQNNTRFSLNVNAIIDEIRNSLSRQPWELTKIQAGDANADYIVKLKVVSGNSSIDVSRETERLYKKQQNPDNTIFFAPVDFHITCKKLNACYNVDYEIFSSLNRSGTVEKNSIDGQIHRILSYIDNPIEGSVDDYSNINFQGHFFSEVATVMSSSWEDKYGYSWRDILSHSIEWQIERRNYSYRGYSSPSAVDDQYINFPDVSKQVSTDITKKITTDINCWITNTLE